MRATAAIHVQPAEALPRGESACMPMVMPLGGRVDRYGALDVKVSVNSQPAAWLTAYIIQSSP